MRSIYTKKKGPIYFKMTEGEVATLHTTVATTIVRLVVPRGPPRRASAYEISKSTGFHVDFGFQNGFLDFKMDFWISSGFLDFEVDFWISKWISGFQSGFLDFKVDFWISKWISGFQADFWISFEPLLF